jgi:hypothetical protein
MARLAARHFCFKKLYLFCDIVLEYQQSLGGKMARYKSLQERLSKQSCSCRHPEGSFCRIWTGYKQKDGYPSADDGYGRMNMQRGGRSLKFWVHRVAKVLEEILIIKPDFDFYKKEDKQLFFDLYDAYAACGLTIDHLCRRTLCLEPTHLEWVRLTKNQQRKKWSDSKLRARIHLNKTHETNHHKMVRRSKTVKELIKKINSKQFRLVRA